MSEEPADPTVTDRDRECCEPKLQIDEVSGLEGVNK